MAGFTFNNETKVLHTGGSSFHCPVGGIGKLLYEKMKNHAELGLVAQIEGETGKEELYDSYLNKCICIAKFMIEYGIKPGDVISMCAENTLNNMPVFTAALFMGAVIAPTDPKISTESTKFLLEMVQPKLIFICEISTNLIQEASKDLKNVKFVPLYQDGTDFNIISIFQRFTADEINSYEPYFIEDIRTTACILFSSGTSGLPKGACLSHDMLVADFGLMRSGFANAVCGNQRKILLYNTVYWVSAVNLALNNMYHGFIRVTFRKLIPEDVWDDMERLKVDHLLISYYTGMKCIQQLQPHHKMSNLSLILSLAGTLPRQSYDKLKQQLPHVLLMTGYGMTELSVVSTNTGSVEPEYAMVPSPKNLLIKIVDLETEVPLELNQVGELRVKGHGQMTEYIGIDSKDCWDKDGFFKTGDLAYLDDKYLLYIVDRVKQMFKYQSWRVTPAVIENALHSHPAVRHAIVLGIPHQTDDNHALALVVLKENCGVAADELIAFVNSRMDDLHQLRAGLKFIKEEQIPYTSTGKISRIQLKRMVVDLKI